MELSQAIAYHASVHLDGWSEATGWVSSVVEGNFLAFDRFITERSFGQKKRIFQVSEPIPEWCTAVRTPDSRVYLLAAVNLDFINDAAYNNVYLIQEAPYVVEILTLQTTTKASGVGGSAVPVVSNTVYGDMERLSSFGSDIFDTITNSINMVTLPHGTPLTTEQELRIDGILYDVQEAGKTMMTVVAKVSKRSASV